MRLNLKLGERITSDRHVLDVWENNFCEPIGRLKKMAKKFVITIYILSLLSVASCRPKDDCNKLPTRFSSYEFKAYFLSQND
jgi:hypothetical protein